MDPTFRTGLASFGGKYLNTEVLSSLEGSEPEAAISHILTEGESKIM